MPTRGVFRKCLAPAACAAAWSIGAVASGQELNLVPIAGPPPEPPLEAVLTPPAPIPPPTEPVLAPPASMPAPIPPPIEEQILVPPQDTPIPLDAPAQPNPVPNDGMPSVDQPTLFPRDSAPRSGSGGEGATGRDIPMGRAVPEGQLEDFGAGAASTFGFNTENTARPSLAGEQAERERQQIIARAERQANLEHYNFKIGPVPFRFGAGIEFHFTDNANLTNSDKLADISVIPTLNLFGGVRVTPWNMLSIQLGIGYLWNLNRTDLNRTITNVGVGLDTDSGINFDFKFGNFHITLYDRPAIPRQQFDLITQRNAFQFAQFTNTAGVSVFWDANTKLGVNFSYNFLTVIGLASELEGQDQMTHQISAAANYRISDNLTFGLQANASWIDYMEEFLNDAQTFNAGVNLAAMVTRNITLNVTGGYQVAQFASGGAIQDSSGLGSWYFDAGVSHAINRFLNHTLSVGHEAQLGTASNTTTVDYIRYQLNTNIWRNFGLGGTASYDVASESGGIFAQDFTFVQFGVFGYWMPAKRVMVNFGYRFLWRDANSQGLGIEQSLDYTENRVDVSVQLSL